MDKTAAIEAAMGFHCPRFRELPNMSLYLEQMIDITREATKAVINEVPTGPMINNYVKLHALPPAVRKKYTREHLCYLIVITLLKNVYTLPQIAQLFAIQRETYPLEVAYDFFCQEFENVLQEAFQFTGKALPCIETKRTEQTILIRSIVLTAANRIFVEKTYFSSGEAK